MDPSTVIIDVKPERAQLQAGKEEKPKKIGLSGLKPAVRKRISPRTEVVESYSFKMSDQMYGGNQYESTDFFASQKVECAVEDEEVVADAIHEYCRARVLKRVRQRADELAAQRALRSPR